LTGEEEHRMAGGASEAPLLAGPPGLEDAEQTIERREQKKWTGFWPM